MSGRRAGNRIRGPQSALTDFLAANNISAAQIRSEYEQRQRDSEQQATTGAESATASTTASASAAPRPPALPVDSDDEEVEEARTKKRKRSEKDAIDKIKKDKAAKSKKPKKKKKNDSDDDDDDDFDFEDFGRKAKPAPGQFEHCEICSKRFTVTPYSLEGPDGGLLCTPCGKDLKKDAIHDKKKAAARPGGKKRRKLESDRLDGIASGGAKSLVQLCIEKIAANHEDVEELGDMPQPVLERLSMIYSKKRLMKPGTLPLFLRGDLEDVVITDAAYLETENYHEMFAKTPKMKRLVLGNACQMKDESIEYMLERCTGLQHISLYAANLVTDKMWREVCNVVGEKLEVIKLKWLDNSFDDSVVEEMVLRCPNLVRVRFELCRKLSDRSVTALSHLPNLQHLSLGISHEVPSATLCDLISKRGAQLRTLSLRKFIDADDSVLQAIHDNCHELRKFRISENDTATDAGYTALFTNWRNPALAFVDINSARDVDNNNPDGPEDPIGLASNGFRALMAHSGPALQHLDIASCRHIELGAFMDVFNGAQSYPALEHINISFCNRADTSVVAGIFKSCPALKKLVAFGCFDVHDVVVPRNIALIGVPRAQDAIEQFGMGIDVDEAIGRMVEVMG